MTKGPPLRFDIDALCHLAGDKVFARGQAYHQAGQVTILAIEPSRVMARVSGSEDYRAVLTGSGTRIGGECSCPAFEDFGFCKHLVATALTANDTDPAPGNSALERIRSHLRGKDTESLVAMIVDLAERDDLLFRWPEHFYEVEMIKPVRGSKDQLLNREAIATYLSQVAPVPFSPDFAFGAEIREHLVQHLGELGEIHIHIDGSEEPIYRPYRDDYAYGEGKRDTFMDLQSRTIEARDGGVGAVVWFLHHGYYGAIPVGEGVGGLRARKGNIQVGDHRIFAGAFPEARFASWTVGEVHILDSRVQPNGRRDEFEQNVHYEHLIARLSEIGTEIGRMCRNTSDVRNRLKKFEFGAQKINEKLEILEQGAVGGADAEAIVADVRSDLYEMKKLTEALVEEDRVALVAHPWTDQHPTKLR